MHSTEMEEDLIRKYAYGFRNIDNVLETDKRFTDEHFRELTRKTQIDTMFKIVSVIISMDSKHAFAVVQPDDTRLFVRWYLLETKSESDYLGQISTTGSFLRAKDIE